MQTQLLEARKVARERGATLRDYISYGIESRGGDVAAYREKAAISHLDQDVVVDRVRGLKYLGGAVDIVAAKTRLILNLMDETDAPLVNGVVWADGSVLELGATWPSSDPPVSGPKPSPAGWVKAVAAKNGYLAKVLATAIACGGKIVPAADSDKCVYLEGGWAFECTSNFQEVAGALALAGVAQLPGRDGVFRPVSAYNLKYAYKDGAVVALRAFRDIGRDDLADVAKVLWSLGHTLLVSESGIYHPSELTGVWAAYHWRGSDCVIYAGPRKGGKRGH